MDFFFLPPSPSPDAVEALYPEFGRLKYQYDQVAKQVHPNKNPRNAVLFNRLQLAYAELKQCYEREERGTPFSAKRWWKMIAMKTPDILI